MISEPPKAPPLPPPESEMMDVLFENRSLMWKLIHIHRNIFACRGTERNAGSRSAASGRVRTPTLAVCLRRERGDESASEGRQINGWRTPADVPVRRRKSEDEEEPG